MRHLQEKYVQPLNRILDEYEEWLRNSDKTYLQKETQRYYLANIRSELAKKHRKK